MQVNRFFGGVVLIVFAGTTAAWLSGMFAIPPELESQAPPMLKAWANPGFLAFPALIGGFAGIVGLAMIVSSFKKPSASSPDESTT